MNESKWKNESGDSKIERAERTVTSNLDRLESAMENLTEKVEESGQKVRHVLDMGVRQKNEFLRLRDQATNTLLPLYERGRAFSSSTYSRVRSDPRPFLYGALILAGGLLLLNMRIRSRARSAGLGRHPSLSIDEPDTWAA